MIHDDDIAEGLPATIVTETRRYFPGLANTYQRSLVKEQPATVGLVKRGDDGVVTAVAVTRERDSKPIYFVRPVDDDNFVVAASAIRLLPHQRDVVWKLGADVLELGVRRMFPIDDTPKQPTWRDRVILTGTPEGAGFPWTDWAAGPDALLPISPGESVSWVEPTFPVTPGGPPPWETPAAILADTTRNLTGLNGPLGLATAQAAQAMQRLNAAWQAHFEEMTINMFAGVSQTNSPPTSAKPLTIDDLRRAQHLLLSAEPHTYLDEWKYPSGEAVFPRQPPVTAASTVVNINYGVGGPPPDVVAEIVSTEAQRPRRKKRR